MNSNNKTENIFASIMYIIIIIVILLIVFVIFISNKNLISNKPDEIDSDTENLENTTNSENTQIDNKNVDETTQSKENNKDVNITIPQQQPSSSSTSTVNPTNKETIISSYSTTLYDKEKTRIENIKLATSKLNGTIIDVNSEFSFNNTIGSMDESNGFKKATGFDTNGKKIKISGGGICQISSTLYNAALLANFKITERHPHSRRVYYVPKNKDATIYYGSLDLKFINTTNSKVKIEASSTNTTVTIKLVKI